MPGRLADLGATRGATSDLTDILSKLRLTRRDAGIRGTPAVAHRDGVLRLEPLR